MATETAIRGGIRALFEGLLPADVVDAYDRLLAHDGCAKDQAEALVGSTGLVQALTDWGMAHIQPHSPANPAWLRPASPDLALQGVLAGHQNRLARDQELLLEGQRRLADAQAQFGIVDERSVSRASGVCGLRPGEDQRAVTRRWSNTARKDWMTLENLNTEMPLTEDFAQPPLPAFGGQVRCRSIYNGAAMDNPAARRIIQTCAAAGEQVRLVPRVPMKMKLADQTTAMLPLTPSGTAGALVIRAPVILASLRDYFEMLWDRATPLKPKRPAVSASRLTPAQQAVLELMAEGLHDAGIARRAGHEYDNRPTARRSNHDPAERHKQIRGGRRRATAWLDRLGPKGTPRSDS